MGTFLLIVVLSLSKTQYENVSFPRLDICSLPGRVLCTELSSPRFLRDPVWVLRVLRLCENQNNGSDHCLGYRSLPYDEPRVLQAALWSDVSVQTDRQRGDECHRDPHHPGIEVYRRYLLRLLRHRQWLFCGGQLQSGDFAGLA